MIKRIILFTVVSSVMLGLSLFLHKLSIDEAQISFNLSSIYLYYFCCSICIYVSIEFLADKMVDTVGYAFLTGIFLKLGLFMLIFKREVFELESYTMTEKGVLIIPLLLFLLLETSFVVVKLKKNEAL